MRASVCALLLAAVVSACAAQPRLVPSLSHAAAPATPDDPSRAHPPPVVLAMESFELESGLRVVVVERHDQPVLVTHLLLARGAVDLGIRRTTARMLVEASLKGTTTRDASRLADDFEALGGPPRWWVDGDGASLQAWSPATGLEGVLELLGDVVAHPAFAPDAMIPLLERWQKASAGFQFHPVELAIFGEAHPYTRETAGPTAGEGPPSLESLVARPPPHKHTPQ
jgi:predicted Zn-dependent peptidase